MTTDIEDGDYDSEIAVMLSQMVDDEPMWSCVVIAKRLHAAGFRRAPAEPAVQGEPTDAQVLVALNTWYAKEREQNGWPIGSNATELADYSPQAQDRMRAALRAAFATRGTDDDR